MTTTKVHSTQQVLDDGNPTDIASALQNIKFGSMLVPLEEDTGTITASATVVLKNRALFIQSTRVVTSGTAGSVGAYQVADSAVTPAVPAAANTNPGVARLGLDGKTLTFPNTVTRVITKYLALAVDPTARFERPGVGQT